MIRGTIAIAALAAVLAAGAAFGWRRAREARAQGREARVAVSISAADDPSWCGTPLVAAVPSDAHTCGKMSFTGEAPGCVFWSQCADVEFTLDCASAGPGRCRCAGGKRVDYRPEFCSLDAADPQRGLRAILESAVAACRQSP